MSIQTKSILFVGAHPDDCDLGAGGTALQLAKAGHRVMFVSLTNGSRGHLIQYGPVLAARRKREARLAGELAKLTEYRVLDHEDSQLEPSLIIREEFLRLARAFRPDLIISHRLNDYHPDHRAAAQIVQDTAYLFKVPGVAPDAPVPPVMPVYGYFHDFFTDPLPFRADAVISIDPVADAKLRMLDCHESQFYEWMPVIDLGLDADTLKMAKKPWSERQKFLLRYWIEGRNDKIAEAYRPQLLQVYGKKEGGSVRFAEAFQQSGYGKIVSPQKFQELLSK